MWHSCLFFILTISASFLVDRVMSHKGSYYLQRAQRACNGGIVLNETSGRFATPGYGKYAANLTCKWSIVVPAGDAISITFIRFDVRSNNPACSRDYVKVLDGGNEVGKYCNPGKEPKKYFTYSSNSNNVTLIFHSYEYTFGGKGVYMKWSSVSDAPLPLDEVVVKVEDSAYPDTRGEGYACVANCTCPEISTLLDSRETCARCIEKQNINCGGVCAFDVVEKCQGMTDQPCPKSLDDLQASAIAENSIGVVSCRGCVDRCVTKAAICGFPNPGWKYKLSPPLSWQKSRDWCEQNFKGDLAVEGLRNDTMRLQIMSYLGEPAGKAWLGFERTAGVSKWTDGADVDADMEFAGNVRLQHGCGLFHLSGGNRHLTAEKCAFSHPAVCAKPCAAQ